MAYNNHNPGGITHWSPRPAGGHGGTGILACTFDTTYARKLAHGITRDCKRADGAVLAAHKSMAEELQGKQADVLQRKVRAHGRAQRDKYGLDDAILSSKNRRVNMSGFTVGYLDDIPQVSKYWRNLDQGTDIFVGRFMRGMFVTADGAEVGPDESRHSDRQLRQFPGGAKFRIKQEIIGYEYLSKGVDEFLEQGYGPGPETLAEYQLFFKEAGLVFLDRLFEKTGGKQPSASQVRLSMPTK